MFILQGKHAATYIILSQALLYIVLYTVIVCSILRPHVWAALTIVRVRFCKTTLRYNIVYYDMPENRSRTGQTDREDFFPRPANEH